MFIIFKLCYRGAKESFDSVIIKINNCELFLWHVLDWAAKKCYKKMIFSLNNLENVELLLVS